jgi:hypothetical protein
MPSAANRAGDQGGRDKLALRRAIAPPFRRNAAAGFERNQLADGGHDELADTR